MTNRRTFIEAIPLYLLFIFSVALCAISALSLLLTDYAGTAPNSYLYATAIVFAAPFVAYIVGICMSRKGHEKMAFYATLTPGLTVIAFGIMMTGFEFVQSLFSEK